MNAVSIPGSEELEVLSSSCIEIVQDYLRMRFLSLNPGRTTRTPPKLAPLSKLSYNVNRQTLAPGGFEVQMTHRIFLLELVFKPTIFWSPCPSSTTWKH
ncbi:hypothetical protein AVEN_136461-1 [Araneus ventricosus]|uniref:Uncharacterized protein n=1 Tax=Araneus ventricosus TaxID=182803 RepID=A0A4Y2JNW2_ARAVE|nr:hypothetical protein AVEN_136461-1 [Araneus ventricosus]